MRQRRLIAQIAAALLASLLVGAAVSSLANLYKVPFGAFFIFQAAADALRLIAPHPTS